MRARRFAPSTAWYVRPSLKTVVFAVPTTTTKQLAGAAMEHGALGAKETGSEKLSSREYVWSTLAVGGSPLALIVMVKVGRWTSPPPETVPGGSDGGGRGSGGESGGNGGGSGGAGETGDGGG